MRKIMAILLLLLLGIILMNVCFANNVNQTTIRELQTDSEESYLTNATHDNAINIDESNSQSKDYLSSQQLNDSDNSPNNSSPLNMPTIKTKGLTKYYNAKSGLKASFFTNDGKVLSNAIVKIKIKNNIINLKTNNEGKINFNINLKPGIYKIIIYNPVTGYKLTSEVKILSTIKSKNLIKSIWSKNNFKAKFLKNNGKPLAHKNVKFKFRGKFYKIKTDKNGIAVFSLKNLTKGKYKIRSYNLDSLSSVNTIVILNKLKTNIQSLNHFFVNKKNNVIKAELKNQFGKPVGSGKKIIFVVDGKKYLKATNSKSVAFLKLPSLNAGKYRVKYKFEGDNHYKASKKTVLLTIIPSKVADFKIKSVTTFGYGFNAPFKLLVKSGKIPLEKIYVYFNINGKNYKKLTNKQGIVSISIKLNVGNYTIKYSIKKQDDLNGKSKSAKIQVKYRKSSVITWKSDVNSYKGPQKYALLLTDLNNKPLVKKVVHLTVKSKTYSATTTVTGHAYFNILVPLGNHKVSFKFKGDNSYNSCKGSVVVSILKKVNSGFGYWVKKEQFAQVDYENLKYLASKGTTDLFLHHLTVNDFGQSKVESWIKDANSLGMKVHFWIPVFKEESGVWNYPIVDGKPNILYINKMLFEIESCCNVKGISGIHLDYIRYPGNAYNYSGSVEAINNFIKDAASVIHEANDNLIVSCAIFSNYEILKYKYGQDFSVISQYVDVVMPMIYKGNNNKDANWIKTTTKWFVENSRGAKIWAGLQTYNSDSDITPLSENEMLNDAKYAMMGGAAGLVLFRWGLVNYINFNSLKN